MPIEAITQEQHNGYEALRAELSVLSTREYPDEFLLYYSNVDPTAFKALQQPDWRFADGVLTEQVAKLDDALDGFSPQSEMFAAPQSAVTEPAVTSAPKDSAAAGPEATNNDNVLKNLEAQIAAFPSPRASGLSLGVALEQGKPVIVIANQFLPGDFGTFRLEQRSNGTFGLLGYKINYPNLSYAVSNLEKLQKILVNLYDSKYGNVALYDIGAKGNLFSVRDRNNIGINLGAPTRSEYFGSMDGNLEEAVQLLNDQFRTYNMAERQESDKHTKLVTEVRSLLDSAATSLSDVDPAIVREFTTARDALVAADPTRSSAGQMTNEMFARLESAIIAYKKVLGRIDAAREPVAVASVGEPVLESAPVSATDNGAAVVAKNGESRGADTDAPAAPTRVSNVDDDASTAGAGTAGRDHEASANNESIKQKATVGSETEFIASLKEHPAYCVPTTPAADGSVDVQISLPPTGGFVKYSRIQHFIGPDASAAIPLSADEIKKYVLRSGGKEYKWGTDNETKGLSWVDGDHNRLRVGKDTQFSYERVKPVEQGESALVVAKAAEKLSTVVEQNKKAASVLKDSKALKHDVEQYFTNKGKDTQFDSNDQILRAIQERFNSLKVDINVTSQQIKDSLMRPVPAMADLDSARKIANELKAALKPDSSAIAWVEIPKDVESVA